MLIDPDFLEHWRTRMLVDMLQDECAPLYIMRLWGHCQLRKNDRFELSPHALKAVCRYPGDADEFERVMAECGWVSREGDLIVAEGWAEHNAKLVSAWQNGGTGGRPKKPKRNPRETQPKPTDNPRGTQSDAGLTHEEPIGLDRTGEEESKKNAARSGSDGETPPRPTPADRAEKRAAPVQWDARDGFAVCAFRRAQWARAFPGVDIQHELDKAHAWYTDNPNRRKTHHAKFLGNWLSRAQEHAKQDARAGPRTTRLNDQFSITPDDPDDNPLAKLRRDAERREREQEKRA